jgi:hypothetical protein
MKVGIAIYCTTCRRMKCPRGRSQPIYASYCESLGYCPGWEQEPKVGDLWPNETDEQFGYPSSDVGTVPCDPYPSRDL